MEDVPARIQRQRSFPHVSVCEGAHAHGTLRLAQRLRPRVVQRRGGERVHRLGAEDATSGGVRVETRGGSPRGAFRGDATGLRARGSALIVVEFLSSGAFSFGAADGPRLRAALLQRLHGGIVEVGEVDATGDEPAAVVLRALYGVALEVEDAQRGEGREEAEESLVGEAIVLQVEHLEVGEEGQRRQGVGSLEDVVGALQGVEARGEGVRGEAGDLVGGEVQKRELMVRLEVVHLSQHVAVDVQGPELGEVAQAGAHARSYLVVLQVEHSHARELLQAADRPPTPVLEPKALVHLGPDVAPSLARDLRHHATRHDGRAVLVHGILAVQSRDTRSLVHGERLGGSRRGPVARRRHGHARLVPSERERSPGVVTRRGRSNARFIYWDRPSAAAARLFTRASMRQRMRIICNCDF